MGSSNEPAKLWSNAQAYGLAILCLAVGTAAGYLLRQPKPASPSVAQKSDTDTSRAMPTQEELRSIADKKAQPMLAALQNDPENAKLLADIGGVYFQTRQFPIAVSYYERAAKIKPDADLLVSLANAYYYSGAGDTALATLNRALELDPKSANALFNLGMLKWQVNNDPKGAVAAWQRLLKTNPNHPRREQVESMIARAKKHMNMPGNAKTEKPTM